ncbi:xylulokinase [Brachybacterium endophyticum]|uniref:Xylulose kinase n=1 Tax=Brachybacterium endophyticum TaxID=2182385 RepID=A0A2U2RGU6_9MICO|nr:xylulokinase [Brachybacterium endophyticum]PWH05068.1 xylulokinase [Brachybacterium endophyticum]
MPTVLGIDSSTQATKAVLVDAESGTVITEQRAGHPEGTEVDPNSWLEALETAADGLLEKADAIAVGGQQHGMVLLDENDDVVRPALLWNDTRSAPQAASLIEDLGGPGPTVRRIGSLPVASLTAAKLRWVAEHEPENLDRSARVVLPHDFVSHRLAAEGTPWFSDRGDASGTGYYSTADEDWDTDLLHLATGGRPLELPALPASPQQVMGRTARGAAIAAGTGDNMAAALGLSLRPGDLSVSIGTSGVCAMVAEARPCDPSGTVTGFADATGRFLPMTTTINAARILDVSCAMLQVDAQGLADLALASAPGAGGVSLLPFFDGERTPDRPQARATLHGMSTSTTRADIARAAVEALLCSLAGGIAALEERFASTLPGGRARRIVLIGGAARNEAVRRLAPAIFGREVTLAPAAEYVALGAARQAAWALAGTNEPPQWHLSGSTTLEAEPTPQVLEAYRELEERTETWT